MAYVDPFEEFKKKKIAKEHVAKPAPTAAAPAPADELASLTIQRPAKLETNRAERLSTEAVAADVVRPAIQSSLQYSQGGITGKTLAAGEVAEITPSAIDRRATAPGTPPAAVAVHAVRPQGFDTAKAEKIANVAPGDKPQGFESTTLKKAQTDADAPAEKPKGITRY